MKIHSTPGVTGRIWGFLVMGGVMGHQACGRQMGERVPRACQKSFKPDPKGKGINPGWLETSLGAAWRWLRDGVLVSSFHLPPQRQELEIRRAAKLRRLWCARNPTGT